MSFQPPPRAPPSTRPSTSAAPEQPGWKQKMKATSTVWGKKAVVKTTQWSDTIGGKVNTIAETKFGTEAFWPVTGDFEREMAKCARILRAFTVDGVVVTEKEDGKDRDKDKKKSSKRKVLRKVPPAVIREAKGVAIFTAFRSGIAPLGGAGGAGLVVAKLPDGSWSAPASISPNNFSTGLLVGLDVYDCLLIIRTQQALDTFSTHKFTLGAEIGVAAGPFGAGAAVEAGRERAPVFSYVKSRGLYAGIEAVAQVFVERFDENASMYYPKVKAGDILAGKVRLPPGIEPLHAALHDAETGRAQAMHNDGALDVPLAENADLIELGDGEVLKLPPTPDMTDGTEAMSDPETEIVHRQTQANSQPPPPPHHQSYPSRLAAPPLPARKRPGITQQHSSASHYSDALDDVPAYDAAPRIGELSLEDGGAPAGAEKSAAPPGHHLTSEAGGPGLSSQPPQPGEEAMSESERREWEQFLAEHQEEERKRERGIPTEKDESLR